VSGDTRTPAASAAAIRSYSVRTKRLVRYSSWSLISWRFRPPVSVWNISRMESTSSRSSMPYRRKKNASSSARSWARRPRPRGTARPRRLGHKQAALPRPFRFNCTSVTSAAGHGRLPRVVRRPACHRVADGDHSALAHPGPDTGRLEASKNCHNLVACCKRRFQPGGTGHRAGSRQQCRSRLRRGAAGVCRAPRAAGAAAHDRRRSLRNRGSHPGSVQPGPARLRRPAPQEERAGVPLHPTEEASPAEAAETLSTAAEIIDAAAKLIPNLGFF